MGKLARGAVLACVWCAVAVSQPAPVVPPDSVVNAASFAQGQPVSPGTLVSVFGTDLATSLAHADSIPLSAAMAGVAMTMNGVPVPLLDTIPAGPGRNFSQINAQVPWNVLPQSTGAGTVMLVVTVNGVSSQPSPVQIVASAPGIFTLNAQGTGQAAVQIGNSAVFAAPAGSIPGIESRPARAGDVLVIYTTGLGPVDVSPATGDIPRGSAANSLASPRVLIGGVEARVQFRGLSPQFVGLNQINAVVPAGVPPGNAVPLQLMDANLLTSDRVTIAMSP